MTLRQLHSKFLKEQLGYDDATIDAAMFLVNLTPEVMEKLDKEVQYENESTLRQLFTRMYSQHLGCDNN